MSKIIDYIMNKKEEQQILIATVDSLSPLKVTLIPGDTAIPVVSTTNLLGLQAGNRVVLQRFGNQFIAIAIVGDPAIQWYDVPANQNIATTNMTNIDGLVFTLKANSGLYAIDTHLNIRCDTSATPDLKLDWEVTGTDYYTICARNCRGGEAQTNSSTTFTSCRNSAGHGVATDVSYTLPSLTTSSHITEHMLILTGVTDTIFQLRASQITSAVNDPITVSSYSHIIVTKLSAGD